MDSATRITATGIGTGVGIGMLAGIASRNVTAGLVTGAFATAAGASAASHVENVRDKYDASAGQAMLKPSVALSLAAGTLTGTAVGLVAAFGFGINAIRSGAALGAGVLAGGVLGLSIVNALGLD